MLQSPKHTPERTSLGQVPAEIEWYISRIAFPKNDLDIRNKSLMFWDSLLRGEGELYIQRGWKAKDYLHCEQGLVLNLNLNTTDSAPKIQPIFAPNLGARALP